MCRVEGTYVEEPVRVEDPVVVAEALSEPVAVEEELLVAEPELELEDEENATNGSASTWSTTTKITNLWSLKRSRGKCQHMPSWPLPQHLRYISR
jgi:hypothetical protein